MTDAELEKIEKRREYGRAYHLANREKRLAQKKANRTENSERERVYSKNYQKKNPDKGAARQRAFKLRYPARVTAKDIKRNTSKSLRTPPWLTPTQWQAMNDIYLESKRLTAAGDDHHVDHIVPLQGKTVCGLHVPWNLQILPATENLQKSATFNDWNLTRAEITALCKISTPNGVSKCSPTSAPSSQQLHAAAP